MHSIIISQKDLTDDAAVDRNVSNRYCKIKIIPPVSLLQSQLTMRVISARSFGSLIHSKRTDSSVPLYVLEVLSGHCQ